MENDPLDPQTFCRLCLQSSSVYFSLFDNESAHMLQSLTSVKINQTDTSTLACPRCLVELQNAYNTQQRLIKNETFLKEKLEQVKETCDIPQEKPEEPKIPKKGTIDDLLVCSVQTHQNKKVNIYTIRTDVDIAANKPNSIESQDENVNTDDSSRKLDVTSNPDLDGINVEYKCAKCPEKFTVASEYVTHLDTHRVECCKICRQEVPVDQLREHRKSHVSGYCEYCGFTSKSRASLQIHINRNHIDPIECKFCGTVSYGEKNHDLHMRIIHTGDATHVCDICGVKFFTLAHLKRHCNMQHTKNKHMCEKCGKSYSAKARLSMHMRKHSDQMLVICEFCGKGFKFACNMRTHQRNVHKWVENDNFQCTKCNKKFGSDQALRNHFRMHIK